MGTIVERPWGTFEVLKQTETYWIKLLTIRPLQKLSLQSHENRDERWVVISGEGVAEVDDEKGILETGTNIYVPRQTKHRIYNYSKTDNLLVCEVANGNCDEADILRFNDDYGRKTEEQ